jgi:hypothetical protein
MLGLYSHVCLQGAVFKYQEDFAFMYNNWKFELKLIHL